MTSTPENRGEVPWPGYEARTLDALRAENRALRAWLLVAKVIVDRQAEDEGLWFHAQTMPEAYLQQELRALADAIERAFL